MISLIIATAAAPLVAPYTSPPPMIVQTPAPRAQSLIALRPFEARCADGALDIAVIEKPTAQIAWSGYQSEKPIVLSFRIDENGRAVGIKRQSADYIPFTDITSSLAVSRFSSGLARNGCSVSYSPVVTKIADAQTDDLIERSIFSPQRAPNEVFERLMPEGSDCYRQRPAVLLRAYPDFDKIPATVGRADWSMVKFDIDADGRPITVRTHATSGNNVLDKASIDAILKSRFAKGAKKGCLYPYWRSAGTLPAPESPDVTAYRGSDEKCPVDVVWKSKPMLVYPDNFRRRAIEGWAIVAFDVVPWGATGNVKLVAAEPAAEFGDAAVNVVRGATVADPGQGFSGCFENVRYVMGASRASDDVKTD